MKKIRAIKNTWYDCLINYISDPIRKSVEGLKDKSLSLFKTKTPKQAMYRRGRNQVNQKHKTKRKKKYGRNISIPFETEEEKKKKKIREKKELNID